MVSREMPNGGDSGRVRWVQEGLARPGFLSLRVRDKNFMICDRAVVWGECGQDDRSRGHPMNMNPRALQLLGGATAMGCGALLCGAVRGQLDEGPVFR